MFPAKTIFFENFKVLFLINMLKKTPFRFPKLIGSSGYVKIIRIDYFQNSFVFSVVETAFLNRL